MALYKIASIYVESDRMPDSYKQFQVNESGVHGGHKLQITYSNNPHSYETARYILDLPEHYSLWESSELNAWLYRDSSTGMSMRVSKDYLNAEVYLPFQEKSSIWMFFVNTALQILLECCLIKEGGVILHASCVQIGNSGIAFSGSSGIGKSTRAQILRRMYSGNWISGDKPLITFDSSGGALANGVPWDGKEHIYLNTQSQLNAILCVVRSEETAIYTTTIEERMAFLAKQVFIPIWDPVLCVQACSSMKRLARVVPLYKMHCDRTEESMAETYRLLLQEINN